MKMRVERCVRCGGNHDELTFVPFAKPSDQWTHWMMCPEVQEPITLRLNGDPHRGESPSMLVEPPTQGQAVTVHQCSRCGLRHEKMNFVPLVNATDEFDHYGVCPATRQPVLCQVVHTTRQPPATAGPGDMPHDDSEKGR